MHIQRNTYEKNKHKLVLTRYEIQAQTLGPSSGCTLGRRLAPLTPALLYYIFLGFFFCFVIEADFLNQLIDTSEPSSFHTFFVERTGTINGYDWFIYNGKLIQQPLSSITACIISLIINSKYYLICYDLWTIIFSHNF